MHNKIVIAAMFLGMVFFGAGCIEVQQQTMEPQPKQQIDQVPESPQPVTITETTTGQTITTTEMGSTIGTAGFTASSTIATTSTITAPPSTTAKSAVEAGSASERYCKRYSGIYMDIYTPNEAWGACYFDDGSECEILSFMRGECSKGGCHEECKNIGTRSEGWYESCTNKLIRWAKCGN